MRFDMTVLNDLDRFHLVIDTIDRLPRTGAIGIYLKQVRAPVRETPAHLRFLLEPPLTEPARWNADGCQSADPHFGAILLTTLVTPA